MSPTNGVLVACVAGRRTGIGNGATSVPWGHKRGMIRIMPDANVLIHLIRRVQIQLCQTINKMAREERGRADRPHVELGASLATITQYNIGLGF